MDSFQYDARTLFKHTKTTFVQLTFLAEGAVIAFLPEREKTTKNSLLPS